MSALELEDVKDYLVITKDVYDLKLQTFIDAAEATLANRVGPLSPTTKTVQVRPVNGSIILPDWPVLSVTSVTPDGSDALVVGDLDTFDGVLSFSSGGYFTSRSYTVVYSAGYDPLPDDLRMAVLEQVRHLWESQRGGTQRPGAPSSDSVSNTVPGAAYALPFRVQALIAPYQVPGVA